METIGEIFYMFEPEVGNEHSLIQKEDLGCSGIAIK